MVTFLFFYDHGVFSINTYHFLLILFVFIESQTRRQEPTFKQVINSSRLQNSVILFLSLYACNSSFLLIFTCLLLPLSFFLSYFSLIALIALYLQQYEFWSYGRRFVWLLLHIPY